MVVPVHESVTSSRSGNFCVFSYLVVDSIVVCNPFFYFIINLFIATGAAVHGL